MIADGLRFPLDLSRGAATGLEFNTELAELENGATLANRLWSEPLLRWDAQIDRRDAQQLQILRDFFRLVGGRWRGFRVRDPLEYRSAGYSGQSLPPITPTDQPLVAVGGSATVFQLVRRVSLQGETLDLPVRRPVAATIRIAAAGVELTSGWSVASATGVVTLTAPVAGAKTWGGEWDFAGRFESDQLLHDVSGHLRGDVAACPLVGVRE